MHVEGEQVPFRLHNDDDIRRTHYVMEHIVGLLGAKFYAVIIGHKRLILSP